jgi:hypothetical protein
MSDGRHVATYVMTAVDAQTELADALFQRPPHGTSPAVRDNLPVKVPFKFSTNSLYVQIWLNGKGPYWIIYDTGASSTWIDDSIVKEAGLEKIPNSDYWATMVYGAFPSYRVRVKSLKVGEAEVRDIVISGGAVWRTPVGNDTIEGKRVIGLLGRETIAAFQTTVNFAERTITFEPHDAPLPEGTVIPFEMAGDHIMVTMTVGQKEQPIRMIVDTGAATNLLPPSYKHDKADGPAMTIEQWYKRLGEFFEGDDYSFFTGDLRVYRINRMRSGSAAVQLGVRLSQTLGERAFRLGDGVDDAPRAVGRADYAPLQGDLQLLPRGDGRGSRTRRRSAPPTTRATASGGASRAKTSSCAG